MMQQQYASLMNLALDEIDAVAPFGPRIRVQVPDLPRGNVSATTFNVAHSTIGAINAGVARDISVNLGKLHQDSPEVATALDALAQAIANSTIMQAGEREAVLEQVAFLVSQAAAAPEERKRGVIKTIMDAVGQAASAVADVASVWALAAPTLTDWFGL